MMENPIETARVHILTSLACAGNLEDQRNRIAESIATAEKNGVRNKETMKRLILHATKDASDEENVDALAELLAERVSKRSFNFCKCFRSKK
jgi:hypothetical protein